MYDHKQVEKDIAKFWKEEKIYEKIKKKNSKGKPFYFCDGPPYATGSIHPGTGWNKTIKDSICKYLRLRGYNVRAQPGYDTHGLPIEVKVEQELKLKHKNEIEKLGVEKFIQRCKEFATKYIGIMNDQFLSLGVWMEFDKPYITYKDEYIEKSWQTLKRAWDRGLMHEGIYVLPYCYRCETTIANYELEYGEETDPSIYVKFKVKDNEYLIIWTTTPWTLVANMGVMVHPTLKYVKVKVDDEIWIIAKDRFDFVMNLIGKSATVIEELSGKKLEGKKYEHPFQDKIAKNYERRVVLSDEYVTTEEGTGLVHTAPGTGPEDFIIGKRFGIEPFCPVDEHGNYTKEAGEFFHGKNVKATNPEIIQILKDNGTLVQEERIRHRYPHCWRCKTPLIFVTTKQWFITISKTKEKMLEEIEKIEWYPDFAKQRFKEFVTVAPDWCISRQRYWGIPLPIWKCKKCEKTKVIDSKKELPKIKELHRPYIDEVTFKCTCGSEMNRISDVLDVWFDSGNAVWASLDESDSKEFSERTDLIIEGQDQIRGWFYSLLGSGIVKYDASPYKRLLMHGFFVDEKGEKMSKSVGNFVPLEEILTKYGADSFRLWGLSNTIWEELKFNWEDIKKASSDLNIALNLVTFLGRFYPNKKIQKAELSPEDHWIISRKNSVIKNFREAFEKYEINQGIKALRNFIVDDISRFYMKIAKDRIGKGEKAEAALYTTYECIFASLKMLSVICPFISEYLYRTFFKKFEKQESVFMFAFEDEDSTRIDAAVERQVEIVRELCTAALNARQATQIKVRWPLRTLWIETKSQEIKESISRFSEIILRLVNVKEVKVVEQIEKKDHVMQEIVNGKIYIEKKIDEELYEEGLVNEVKRRIQMLRKEAELVEKDKISVRLSGEEELIAIVQKFQDKIAKDVNAKEIKIAEEKEMKEFEIDGRKVRIAIKKV